MKRNVKSQCRTPEFIAVWTYDIIALVVDYPYVSSGSEKIEEVSRLVYTVLPLI